MSPQCCNQSPKKRRTMWHCIVFSAFCTSQCVTLALCRWMAPHLQVSRIWPHMRSLAQGRCMEIVTASSVTGGLPKCVVIFVFSFLVCSLPYSAFRYFVTLVVRRCVQKIILPPGALNMFDLFSSENWCIEYSCRMLQSFVSFSRTSAVCAKFGSICWADVGCH